VTPHHQLEGKAVVAARPGHELGVGRSGHLAGRKARRFDPGTRSDIVML
jgi:hypothetical protein